MGISPQGGGEEENEKFILYPPRCDPYHQGIRVHTLRFQSCKTQNELTQIDLAHWRKSPASVTDWVSKWKQYLFFNPVSKEQYLCLGKISLLLILSPKRTHLSLRYNLLSPTKQLPFFLYLSDELAIKRGWFPNFLITTVKRWGSNFLI